MQVRFSDNKPIILCLPQYNGHTASPQYTDRISDYRTFRYQACFTSMTLEKPPPVQSSEFSQHTRRLIPMLITCVARL